ncbi:MAG: class I SAM-dependent methyltransferase [Myxococcota bacterium]
MGGDLSVTALYTSGVWAWAAFPGAELYDHEDSRRVFQVTEAVMRVARFLKGGPSLKHSLVQRHFLIDHLTRSASPETVVELAAGLSRRGASFSESVRYVEVDLPHVIERKEALLDRTEAGREVLGRATLTRIGADVAELDLAPLVEGRTVVVAEGLLMYLDATQQRALWSRVASALPSGAFVFDLVPAIEQPPPGWLGRVLGWLMQRFTGGQGFVVDQRTRDDVRSELLEAGFTSVRWIEPADLANEGVPHLDTPTQTLVFECLTGPVLPSGATRS